MIEREEKEGEGYAGAGDAGRTLIRLVQKVWEMGCIPHQMLWVAIILLSKGGGNYRGIGLIDPIWKVLEVSRHG